MLQTFSLLAVSLIIDAILMLLLGSASVLFLDPIERVWTKTEPP